MKKNLNIWTKLACLMIGWNPELLKECSEASFSTLKKYMSALTLLGVIWGTIGYLFAKMYMRIEPLYQKLLVSFVFIVMVFCIERFIILKMGNSKLIAWMRVIIASLMAILGATMIDQMIFKNDITNAMKIENVKKANEEIELRTINYDKEYAKLVQQRDSVSKELTMNNEKLLHNPYLKTVNYTSNRKVMGTDSLGAPVYAYETQANEQTMENPLAKQVEADRKCFENYQEQLDKITEKKLTLAEDVQQEYADISSGFLEELKVFFEKVISGNIIAMIFYGCLFLFMLSIEILVVTSKLHERKCDYDLLVEQQLLIKEKEFSVTNEKYTKYI